MPRPPPPNAALIATGQPFASPNVDDLVGGLQELGRAGHPGDACGLGRLAAADLVAHDLDGLGRRSDERARPCAVMARAKSVFSEKNP